MTTTVFNLWTGQESVYTLCPFDAVRAAYAQVERSDFNTWNYHNYNHLIKVSRSKKDGYSIVTCGNQSVLFKDGELHGSEGF
jgi:hypothetical protein